MPKSARNNLLTYLNELSIFRQSVCSMWSFIFRYLRPGFKIFSAKKHCPFLGRYVGGGSSPIIGDTDKALFFFLPLPLTLHISVCCYCIVCIKLTLIWCLYWQFKYCGFHNQRKPSLDESDYFCFYSSRKANCTIRFWLPCIKQAAAFISLINTG